MAQTTYYVDGSAVGPVHDGTTWCQAFLNVQEALDVAISGDAIRVADGLFLPDVADVGDPRDATFVLADGVVMEGGYAGCSAANPDERDILAFQTILSGDLNGDDGPNFVNTAENCRHVVTAPGVDASTVLDGVTISGGNADGVEVAGNGGGMLVIGGAPSLFDCTFRTNAAELGGGLHNADATTTLTRCGFAENVAFRGGAIYNDTGRPSLTSCTFRANHADGEGGAMFSFSAGSESPMPVVNSIFTGNSSVSDGGALFSDLTILDLINCTFSRNTSGSRGGGLYNYVGCLATVTNSVFWENNDMFGAGEESQAYNNPSNVLNPNYTCMQGWTGSFGGVGNTGADPLLLDPLGPDGTAGTEDDNLRLASASPSIDAGDNAVVTEVFDLDGNPRIVDHDGDGTATVDMGAYEAQPSGSPIPTVSEWGMVVMIILLLTMGTLVLGPRRAEAARSL